MRQASRRYSFVAPQEVAFRSQRTVPALVPCMVLDLVVEACERVRYSEGVYASVVSAYDIARGVEVRRKLVGAERMVA